jgi:hypothetical protein
VDQDASIKDEDESPSKRTKRSDSAQVKEEQTMDDQTEQS